MSSMMEKVARAMAALDWGDVDKDDSYFRYARAAIEAMREPTEAMKAALGDARKYGTESNGEIFPRKLMSELIDAALKEQP
ncbi:hypothetical protein [Rhizobium leucaenae]|uniref:hypothetical protein n=1 Tax=Rhizobium leucaenae TaxID=29450 RepID=UPI00049103FA|nr:hypothetical protein [Rhizobium leucaenae]